MTTAVSDHPAAVEQQELHADDTLFVALVAVVSGLAGATTLLGGQSVLRTVAVLAFLLVGPGGALAGHSPVSGFYQRLVLSVGLSLVLDMAFVAILFAAHRWFSVPAFAGYAAAASAVALVRFGYELIAYRRA